ncbi:type II secretion system F family protein [Candidatus Woesearchaeota archaeon]|nr:type II secretion system F family protein [Candidatus Woesearchaeota archaeon]
MGWLESPENFGKAFIPKIFRPHLREYFLKAGFTEVPYDFFGKVFYFNLFITFLIYSFSVYPFFSSLFPLEFMDVLYIFLISGVTWFILPILFSVAFGVLLYFYLDVSIYNRTKKMEDVLPDFLRFVSENLKGGMSFEKALWSSIKPEFGILAAEVRLAAKKVMTGQDIEDAIQEFTSKYDSPIVKRAFDLIIEGIKGGGRIADLIDKIIEDIEEMKELKAEMRTTNLSYVIFVTFVVIIVTPALFTLSFQFLQVLQGLSEKISSVPQTTSMGMPISFGSMSIDSNTFKDFSQYALIIISGFSAMIVSIISTGNIKSGLKYIPIYVISSLVMYRIFMAVSAGFFSSMF